MIFRRIKSAGLAQYSYVVGSGDSLVVIDPRRDCHIYREIARSRDARVTAILETHCNEDFVTGSLELSGMTGAPVYHGPGLRWRYGNTLQNGQEFELGQLTLKALQTPGHTDESTCYILQDRSAGNIATAVFSGDTLFAGATGRTDLYGPDHEVRLASALHESLFQYILPLGDGVVLWPAHGAGSVCGRLIADREYTTLGIERISNPTLQMPERDTFIGYKVREYNEKPYYFSQMEKYNLEGPPPVGDLSLPGALSPAEFAGEMEKGAIVVDTREPTDFGGAHIKGAYSIWLEGLPVFGGWVLPCNQPLLLVLEDPGNLERAYRYLIRIGYDRITGYLRGGIEGWYNRGLLIEKLPLLTVHELKERLGKGELSLLDVRGTDEWGSGHVPGAAHIYVGHLEQRLAEVPRDRPLAVMCNVGRRASLGASILQRAGFPEVYNVLGSMTAWRAAGYPVAD